MIAFPKSGTLAGFAIALTTYLLTAPAGHADGVFIYKNQTYHSDELAKAFRYESIEPHDRFVWVTTGGKRLRFERTTPYAFAELTDTLPNRIATREEIAALEKQLQEIERISRYPAATALAQPTLDLLREAKASLDQGLIRNEGNWISRESYETAEKERLDSEEKLIAEMAANRKAREAEQKAIAEEKAASARKKLTDRRAERQEKLRAETAEAFADVVVKAKKRLADSRQEVTRLKADNTRLVHELNEIFKTTDAR